MWKQQRNAGTFYLEATLLYRIAFTNAASSFIERKERTKIIGSKKGFSGIKRANYREGNVVI